MDARLNLIEGIVRLHMQYHERTAGEFPSLFELPENLDLLITGVAVADACDPY